MGKKKKKSKKFDKYVNDLFGKDIKIKKNKKFHSYKDILKIDHENQSKGHFLIEHIQDDPSACNDYIENVVVELMGSVPIANDLERYKYIRDAFDVVFDNIYNILSHGGIFLRNIPASEFNSDVNDDIDVIENSPESNTVEKKSNNDVKEETSIEEKIPFDIYTKEEREEAAKKQENEDGESSIDKPTD